MTTSEPDPAADLTTGVAASVFEQAPLILMALEGPDLRVVAWSSLAEQILAPAVGGLGSSVWDRPWIRASGAHEALRRVLDSGEALTGHALRVALPDSAEQAQEVYLDLTYTPWRWPDGSFSGATVT